MAQLLNDLSFFLIKPKISPNCLCKQPQTDLWGSQQGCMDGGKRAGEGGEAAVL